MARGLMGKAKQQGEGAACHPRGDELFWMSRSPSPSERGGSPCSGPQPGSGKIPRHFGGLRELLDWMSVFKRRFHFDHHVGREHTAM